MIGLFLFFLFFKILDVFWLKLDDEWGEILLSKSLSVVFILFFLVLSNKTLSDIGLKKRNFRYLLLLGLGFVILSILTMRVAYTLVSGNFVAWDITDVALTFVYFTLMTNVVNVMMEESLFRGIFVRMSCNVTQNHMWKVILLQAFFFGIWHVVTPLKELVSRNMVLNEAILYAIVLTLLSFLVAIPWGYYYYKTSSLLPSLVWHLLWNTMLGILPLPSENLFPYLLALFVGSAVGLASIPLFDRIVKKEYLAEIKPWRVESG
jgi:membrane protease YdiL (CAAX protease family)